MGSCSSCERGRDDDPLEAIPEDASVMDLAEIIENRRFRRNEALERLPSRLESYPREARSKDHMHRLPIHIIASTHAWGDELVNCIQALIKANPEGLTAIDRDGNTPLHLACRDQRLELVRMFFYGNTEAVSIKGTTHGFLPLHRACSRANASSDKEWLEFIYDLLVAHPLGSISQCSSGRTPIWSMWTWRYDDAAVQEHSIYITTMMETSAKIESGYNIAVLILLFAYAALFGDTDGNTSDSAVVALQNANLLNKNNRLPDGNISTIVDTKSPAFSKILLALVTVGNRCRVPFDLCKMIVERNQTQLLVVESRTGELPLNILSKTKHTFFCAHGRNDSGEEVDVYDLYMGEKLFDLCQNFQNQLLYTCLKSNASALVKNRHAAVPTQTTASKQAMDEGEEDNKEDNDSMAEETSILDEVESTTALVDATA